MAKIEYMLIYDPPSVGYSAVAKYCSKIAPKAKRPLIERIW